DVVQRHLAEAGVPTAVHYPIPLNEQPAYKNFCCAECTPVAQQAAKRVLSLPMGADLEDKIIESIKIELHKSVGLICTSS
ncbi:DegT/DnrJ/EryC1/StrS family aminotransferase, partial [Vibrio vulnificus]|uniref:DegT/DnrJ/EryC1/StrS family aminotransferase n=1 Tax=Vibrio vulnificus TaxID=672 RepID=UPI0039B65052